MEGTTGTSTLAYSQSANTPTHPRLNRAQRRALKAMDAADKRAMNRELERVLAGGIYGDEA